MWNRIIIREFSPVLFTLSFRQWHMSCIAMWTSERNYQANLQVNFSFSFTKACRIKSIRIECRNYPFCRKLFQIIFNWFGLFQGYCQCFSFLVQFYEKFENCAVPLSLARLTLLRMNNSLFGYRFQFKCDELLNNWLIQLLNKAKLVLLKWI